MVNDSLVLVNFDSNVGIGLSGNSSWFYELPLRILIDIITTLRGINIWTIVLPWNLLLSLTIIYLFRAPTHRLIIEFTALLLQLIIAHIKRIPAQTMISHSHLIATSSSELKTGVVLALVLHHIKLVVIISAAVHFFVVRSCSKDRAI